MQSYGTVTSEFCKGLSSILVAVEVLAVVCVSGGPARLPRAGGASEGEASASMTQTPW